MSRAAYSKVKCYICNKEISVAGAAYVSHMRKHVREGKLREIPADWRHKYPRIKFERVSDRKFVEEK